MTIGVAAIVIRKVKWIALSFFSLIALPERQMVALS